MAAPTVIPSSIDVGKAQMVVVVFPCDIPQDELVTLELSYCQQQQPSRRSPAHWRSRIPGKPLGPNSLLAIIPETPHPGELEVEVKVSRDTFSPCPQLRLPVLGPLEVIVQAASSSQQRTSGSAPLACAAAYLLHSPEKDQRTLGHLDTTLCGLLSSQPSLWSKWNLSSIVFGKYGSEESLLHLLVRRKLEGAVDILLQNAKGKEMVLQQRDYKGRTPAGIARKKGSKRMAETLTEIAKSYSTEHAGTKVKLKKAKSLDNKLDMIGLSEEGSLSLPCTAKVFDKGRFKNKQEVTCSRQPQTLPHSDSWPPGEVDNSYSEHAPA
jgi:hypothetical protein